MLKLLARLAMSGSVLIALLILIQGWLPDLLPGIVISYALVYGPRWIWLLPAVLALLLIVKLKPPARILSVLSLAVIIRFQDLQLSFPSPGYPQLRVITFNAGQGSFAPFLKDLVDWHDADVVLLQEAGESFTKRAFGDEWYTHCHFWKCVASRYPLEHTGLLHLNAEAEWGHFAAMYQIQWQGQIINLANVHLATPRPVLETLLNLSPDPQMASSHHEKRRLQASFLSSWAKQNQPVIVGGDFNMSEQDTLYREFFSGFGNAIDQAGSAVNYTKYTSWHGTRIDHVLFGEDFRANQAEALEAIGGDHRAVLAALSLKE
ncbi:endonuclease/exonuclease/phosphatase family protein [Aliagarivorans taiwanensis]|uniref:endonuclease/exonuclease/phosphatase family protein n=1 Tax=Aliagarivorans taiwanensis TaxID=561966 RepID=UPI00146FAD70|nr:endonuclease/exonuclease/phosphatase family protein [Aliagarivorans taiwanensis]